VVGECYVRVLEVDDGIGVSGLREDALHGREGIGEPGFGDGVFGLEAPGSFGAASAR
jgi:hypothetical protein